MGASLLAGGVLLSSIDFLNHHYLEKGFQIRFHGTKTFKTLPLKEIEITFDLVWYSITWILKSLLKNNNYIHKDLSETFDGLFSRWRHGNEVALRWQWYSIIFLHNIFHNFCTRSTEAILKADFERLCDSSSRSSIDLNDWVSGGPCESTPLDVPHSNLFVPRSKNFLSII